MKRWVTVLSLAGLIVFTFLPSANATTWYVKANGTGDVATIQDGVEAAQHGDTLLCAAGTYNWNNQNAPAGDGHGMIAILRGSANMTIISESGPEVTFLDAQNQGRVFFFQGETELHVEGFTFMRGVAPALGNFVGGGFAAHLSSPVLKNCIFRSCTGNQGGAYWYGGVGAPQILDCVFEDNVGLVGGAIFLVNTPLTVLVSNTLIRNNSSTGNGAAIYAANAVLDVEYTTFVRNISGGGNGGGLHVTDQTTVDHCTFYQNEAVAGSSIYQAGTEPVIVENTIMALGIPAPIRMADALLLTISCTDLYGNIGGNWTGNLASFNGINGNFTAPPDFCGPSTGDFRIHTDSPCAPGNHPDNESCGVIGAHPIGCGVVPVEHRSWGSIKALYSD